MAFSKSAKQTYFGRVISPATPKDINGKPILEFSIAIDNLVSFKNDQGQYEKKSLFIKCTYAPRGKNPALDPVVAILTRISTKDQTNTSLAGATFKSVEVWVEGSEGYYENADGKLYKNLRFCDVQVTDNTLLQAFYTFKKAATGQSTGTDTQQAVVAPTQPQVATPTVGTIQDIGGTLHQLVGADPSVRENWVPGQIVSGQFVAMSSQQSLVAQSTVNNSAPVQATPPPAPVPPAAVAPAAVAPPAPPVSSVKSALTGGADANFVTAPPAVPGVTS